MKNNLVFKICILIIITIAIATIVGPIIISHNPLGVKLDEQLKKPSMVHVLGTDEQGRDVLSRILYGARISLGIGVLATITSLLIGLVIGLIAGYSGGMIDRVICSVIDIMLSFPSLLLAIGITVVMSPGMWTVILALTVVGWASLARFTRGLVLNFRNTGFVESARSLGLSKTRIMFYHILPNCMPLIIIAGFLRLGTFILSEASLSFLGLGVPPPTPTWGGMINFGIEYIRQAPWIVFFPGLMLAFTVVTCNLLGDVLRDFLDPKTRNLL